MKLKSRFYCPFLSQETNSQIETYLANAYDALGGVLNEHPLEPFLGALYQAYHPYEYAYMPDFVRATYREIEEEFGVESLGRYNKIVTLHLMSRVDEVIEKQRIPDAFLVEFPRTMESTWSFLQTTADKEYVYPGDFIVKDLRILTGRSISYGSQVMDRDSYLRKNTYRNNGWVDNFKCLWFLVTQVRGLGPFYRWHLDHRHMDHSNDEDTFDFRILMGELLELNPEVKGTLGTGWLVDPQLAIVSPKYAKRFKDEFAKYKFLRYDGISEETTRRALEKSKTRREAFERGEYQPANYTQIRARKGHLLRAEKHRRMKDV